MKPNGVFYIDGSNKASIITTEKMTSQGISKTKFATQSGPMLLINGEVHPSFNKESKNLLVRNGVGILPNGGVIFSISTEPVSFYNFAKHFKEKGCKNALYLDGVVSRVYYPEKKLKSSTNDKFGVMIAVVE